MPKLEEISELLLRHQTYYTFNKVDEHLSKEYRKGRIKSSKWLSDLVYFYVQKERKFLQEYKENLQEQKKKLIHLEDSDFKKGLFDELNLIEEMIDGTINNRK